MGTKQVRSRLPDFLVIGAQKSGTTSLFVLLKKHPHIYLPAQKEVQFFSSEMLYAKGLEWYRDENFRTGGLEGVAGEISPQYMMYQKVPARIEAALPKVKLIAILRHPLRRAFSQYQMNVRRELEKRDFPDAFRGSLDAYTQGRCLPEAESYYQFSNYAEILAEYLRLFPKERMLILFQEDLARAPGDLLLKIHDFLGVARDLPSDAHVRANPAGIVRSKRLDRFSKRPSMLRALLKPVIPSRFRGSIRFWLEIKNTKPVASSECPDDVLREHAGIVLEQARFLEEQFGVVAPWGQESQRPKGQSESR